MPRLLNSMNCGTIVTSPGSSMVASTTANTTPVNRTRNRANANPASAHENTVPMIGISVVSNEFSVYRQNGNDVTARV